MVKIIFPPEETYKAIADRFPRSLAAKHIQNEKQINGDIVKTELVKIISGNDLDGGYDSPEDVADAQKYFDLLQNPEQER